ncbi:MAG: hypothetical protein C0506_08260 [Anaerolinea sp.]|nr:hypothetical protein [Anaerolinea sp.]
MKALMAVLIVAALALLPQFVAAHGGSEVAITGHPHPDGPIEIKGTDFEPGEVAQLELRKQGEQTLVLGQATAGPDGTFAITLHLPSTVRPGLYTLVAASGEETTSAEATILGVLGQSIAGGATTADETVSNDRPTGETVGLAIVTAVLGALGVAVILNERRQSARPFQES